MEKYAFKFSNHRKRILYILNLVYIEDDVLAVPLAYSWVNSGILNSDYRFSYLKHLHMGLFRVDYTGI